MTPKALIIPAMEGNTDAQAMLADFLKEQGAPDCIADEAYCGALHMRTGYRYALFSHTSWWSDNGVQRGHGAGAGSALGLGCGFGSRQGLGSGGGSGYGRGYGTNSIFVGAEGADSP